MYNLGGGQFLYGNGLPISNGTLVLALSASATIIATSGPAPSSYTFPLDSNGVIEGAAPVYSNAELSPAGTYYIATVLDSHGNTVWGPVNWAVGPTTLYSGSLYPNVTVLPPWLFPAPSGSTAVLPAATVSFSATPVFNASSNSFFTITLTGNVTSSSISGAVAGQLIVVRVIQDGTGGRTFTWPTNFKGGMVIDGTANAINTQAFIYDGTNATAIGPGTVN